MDLLLEVEQLGWLEQHVDEGNYVRTCLYLVSTCAYLPEADDRTVLHVAYSIYQKVSRAEVVPQQHHSACDLLPAGATSKAG